MNINEQQGSICILQFSLLRIPKNGKPLGLAKTLFIKTRCKVSVSVNLGVLAMVEFATSVRKGVIGKVIEYTVLHVIGINSIDGKVLVTSSTDQQ